MPQLKWTPAALEDIARLHAFLADKGGDAAGRAIKAIRETVGTLRQHSEAGRPMPEMDPEFREWFVEFGAGGYVALYHYGGGDVVILAVRHVREAGY